MPSTSNSPVPRRTTVLLVFLLAGCGVTRFPTDGELRLARDTPDFFRFAQAMDRERCQNPAVDPADGMRLALLRSQGGRGDYEVPEGRYGARPDEVLRISCATGRPIGFVPR